MSIFKLISIDTTLIVASEFSASRLICPVMIHILTILLDGQIVQLHGFGNTAQPFCILLPVNIADAKHIVDCDQCVVEFSDLRSC